jgi:hypothetical protein
MPPLVRLAGLVASAAASSWQFASGNPLGGAVFALLTVFAVFSVVPGGGRVSRRWNAWFGGRNVATASRTGALALLTVASGLAQITGYGLHRDLNRGILQLLASNVFIILTVDLLCFRDRRREREHFERQRQDEWLQRIAPRSRVPPDPG